MVQFQSAIAVPALLLHGLESGLHGIRYHTKNLTCQPLCQASFLWE